MKSFEIEIPIFHHVITVLVGTKEDVMKEVVSLSGYTYNMPSDNTAMETYCSGDHDVYEYIIIACYDELLTQEKIIQLVHEILHVSWNVCKHRGLTIDDEILCYLQGYVLNECLKCMNVELTVVTKAH